MKNASCDLASCFLCQHCTPDWRELVAVKKKTVHFRKGELIFQEGDKLKGFFFLTAGAVKLHKEWGEQKELIIRFAREGDILGHRGFGLADTYPVSATALLPATACFISLEFLEATLRTDHGFTQKLLRFYAGELQKAELRMRNLALMEVKGRVAEALLELQHYFGTSDDGAISIAITRQDISAFAGTTYETVFKLLRSFSAEGWISASGKQFTIHASEQLQRIIEESKG